MFPNNPNPHPVIFRLFYGGLTQILANLLFSRYQPSPPPPPEMERETPVKEYREWRIPDIALVVSQDTGAKVFLTWALSNVKVEITAPALSEGDATIPVIIEVKGQRSDDPFYVLRTLVKVELQLQRQAGFLFSDFKLLQEVVAIAGVGLYWRWSKITRASTSSCGQSSDDGYEFRGHPSSDSGNPSSDPGADFDPLLDQDPPPTTDRTPFIIGTEGSTQEVLKLKTMVQEIAERELGIVHGPEDTKDLSEDDTVDYRELLRTLSKSGNLDKWEVMEGEGKDDQKEESIGSGRGSYASMDEDAGSGGSDFGGMGTDTSSEGGDVWMRESSVGLGDPEDGGVSQGVPHGARGAPRKVRTAARRPMGSP